MKTHKNMLFFGLFILVLTISCSVQRPITRTPAENNSDYKINYLFEHDGCKVYRFYDDGRYVYFTNCTGNVTSITNDSTAFRVQNTIRKD